MQREALVLTPNSTEAVSIASNQGVLEYPPPHGVLPIKDRIIQWKEDLGTGEDEYELAHMLADEVQELIEALQVPDNRAEVAGELGDIGMTLVQLTHKLGVDMTKSMEAKYERNNVKYNPQEAKELQNEGLEPREVVVFMRNRWDKSRDQIYMTGL